MVYNTTSHRQVSQLPYTIYGTFINLLDSLVLHEIKLYILKTVNTADQTRDAPIRPIIGQPIIGA